MDTTSKVIIGFAGSIVVYCIASCVRVGMRARRAAAALDTMETELEEVNRKFINKEFTRAQAEKVIDLIVTKYKAIYLVYTVDATDVNQFFAKIRAASKQLLGSVL